jgi:hypothetical protein
LGEPESVEGNGSSGVLIVFMEKYDFSAIEVADSLLDTSQIWIKLELAGGGLIESRVACWFAFLIASSRCSFAQSLIPIPCCTFPKCINVVRQAKGLNWVM